MAGRRAALLANHGVVATGETLAGAHALALEVE
ncbi:MAG: class II aldolase/adducin family protein, partial [Roseomonas sp.]|nr:class II aldolase/adducin family protein [Roseomonas sp.]